MTTHDDTPAITDSHLLAHPPGPELAAWLGDAPHTLDGNRLILHTDLGDMYPRAGWTLLKWSDGEITVASPRTVERVYGPHGLLGQAQHAVTRVRALADSWAKAGPPPPGTSISRWVDARLIELNTALDQTTER
ncbi:hypothetical protein [Streptomyces scabiei]|uniref:Uncharacterized protein n=1 Tax=Streptomyces scabiei TaxID=1930 RepID=A0A100JLU2_STRSC|nr:hypothetical protein [Streptomyces scabiei]GAQ61914.1 hypothetical protein SsS58_02268 [Streptomyces scabiei]